MNTRRSLSHALPRVGESASARHARSAWSLRNRATRGILVLALAFASLGAAALAWPGHGSGHAGHHHAVTRSFVPKTWMY